MIKKIKRWLTRGKGVKRTKISGAFWLSEQSFNDRALIKPFVVNGHLSYDDCLHRAKHVQFGDRDVPTLTLSITREHFVEYKPWKK